ncbi:MAG TPA: hypothetical protein VGN42_00285 [Pirellulales bacterium]|jgi:hypothetical protein|nr:hypothetical protein [Pirellulales bacterium]
MTTSSTPPKPLADSPLFWLLLFGSAALVMLAVVQPKFAQREARLERMYHSRQLAAQAAKTGAARRPSDPSDFEADEYAPAEPIVTLRPLMFLLSGVVLAAWIALAVLRRRQWRECSHQGESA